MSEKVNKQYNDFWNEINKRELSNSEGFDKAILSLSSAGLALSLTFIRFVVPLEEIKDIYWLYSTWCLFGASIILTIFSFLVSQMALRKSLSYAEKCYIQDEESFCNKKCTWGKIIFPLNFLIALIFVSAIISVIMFAFNNFDDEKYNKLHMNKTKIVTINPKTYK